MKHHQYNKIVYLSSLRNAGYGQKVEVYNMKLKINENKSKRANRKTIICSLTYFIL